MNATHSRRPTAFSRLTSAVRAVAAAAVFLTVSASSVDAQSLTTLFASDNGNRDGGTVYFDALVGPRNLTVTGFDINVTTTGTTFSGFQVWLLAGTTSQGNEAGAGWVQVATGSGTYSGFEDLPTAVTLSNTFNLNAGTLYGFALVNDPAVQHEYTNGTGTNQVYSNADLTLTLGSASDTPPGTDGGVFSPRVWNGTIYYSASQVPEPASLALLGFGLVGLVGVARRRSSRSA